MGDVLAGIHATWEFESDAVVIRFDRGIRTPKLLGALRERRVPHEALASVTLAPGRRGTLVLHAEPRAGADPLMEAAAGQLKDGCDPYRLVLPAERGALAERHLDELRAVLADRPGGTGPVDGFLVAPPAGPQSFKAYDGKATFDGTGEIGFRWFCTGASSEKWKAGDQTFRTRELSGVEWHSPEHAEGCLRLLRRDAADEPAPRPDHDPASVVFGFGYGSVHESLPFAAAVLAAIRGGSARYPAPVPAQATAAPSSAAAPVAVPVPARPHAHADAVGNAVGDSAERIRQIR
ncbi:DUF4429 domain-containing protein [Streptomyces sp. NPDC090025]|uniref:DUF4429 domain-containing protein n=1 Tax=Streptomyces sp. NPDC090025 TaxID=3365922 RepID=UPI0038338733